MLRIPRRRTSGAPPRFGAGDEVVAARPAARVIRVLPWSPVYPVGGEQRAESASVTVGARLRRALGDGRYHAVSEVVGQMSARDFTRAAEELLVSGYCLDVAGGAVRLRNRGRVELPQRLVDVVVRLDLSRPREEISAKDVAQPVRAEPEEVAARVKIEAGLVLSDPPGDLSLPAEWTVAVTCAVLGQRGAGKTYLAGVLVEELRARVPDLPVVVVDPTGSWWGIQVRAQGGASDLGVVVLGGEHGAVDLAASSGTAAADLARELGTCVVLDLSRLGRSEQVALVADFFERLRTFQSFPVHVVVDEADLFCPQRFGALGGDHRRCADAVEDFFMRGRLAGRGGTVVSLRPAVVSKNVLSQVECLFLLRMVEPNDLRAASSWLERHEHGVSDAQREECLAQMPALPAGTAYFLRGGDEATFRRFRTRAKRTHDSSRTLGKAGAVEVRCEALPAEVLARVTDVMSRAVRDEEGEGG